MENSRRRGLFKLFGAALLIATALGANAAEAQWVYPAPYWQGPPPPPGFWGPPRLCWVCWPLPAPGGPRRICGWRYPAWSVFSVRSMF
jgi:hypothetical protein